VYTAAAAAADTCAILPQELDLEGSNEETGRQLCGLITTLADMHWAHVDSVQKQHQILKYVSHVFREGGGGGVYSACLDVTSTPCRNV
jgi:hypothetical protein